MTIENNLESITTRMLCVLMASISMLCCAPPTDAESAAKLAYGHQKIISGDSVETNSWQGVAVVEIPGGFCTGTLIHPQIVITAAHCIYWQGKYDLRNTPDSIGIISGSTLDAQNKVANGEEIQIHPTWTGLIEQEAVDLALILLDTEIVDLPVYSLQDFPMVEEGSVGKIVGYGAYATNGSGAGIKREGDTTLLDVFYDRIETGDPTNTCNGDSGGPLFTKQDGEWRLAGITSFADDETCDWDGGSFSTHLLAYCDWINKTMLDLVGEDLGLEHCTGCEPDVVASWGQPCGEGYFPCPEGMICHAPMDFTDGTTGYCGPSCCDLNQEDNMYCRDMGSGLEKCALMNADGNKYCVIFCEQSTDCPEGTECVSSSAGGDDKICVTLQEGPGGPGTVSGGEVVDDADLVDSGGCSTTSPGRFTYSPTLMIKAVFTAYILVLF